MEWSESMKNYIKLLTPQGRDKDVNSFNRWKYRDYGIESLKRQIARHNLIPEVIYGKIRDEEFEAWANTLGWRRHEQSSVENTDI